VTLPNVAQAAVDDRGHFTASWRNWLAQLERTLSANGTDGTSLAADIAAIATALGSPDGTVGNIPDQSTDAFVIVSPDGTIRVTGSPSAGTVTLTLNATTDNVPEGASLYYTDERAQDAVAALIAAGTHTGITFTYNDTANSLSATVTASGSVPTGTGFRHVTSGSEDSATKLVDTVDINNNQVTYAKLQDVSATSRILGRKTAGAGDPEECTLSEVLDFIGSAAQGDILYRGASGWARLGAGTAGNVLCTNGAGANPAWQTVGSLAVGPGGVRYVAPAFSSVSSLLHFNGTNGSTTITDQIAGNTWTAQASTISTAQSVFGGSAVNFTGGSNSCISCPTNSKFNVGAGDWAMEFRIYPNGTHQTSARIFQTRDGDVFSGISLLLSSTNVLQVFLSTNGTDFSLLNGSTGGTLTASAWNTVILQRTGSVIQCFVNGYVFLSIGITPGASLYYNAADTLVMGGNKTGVSRSINAYIDEFRFTKGSAVVAPDVPPLTSAFPDS
jgi:hypothetical protein